MGLRSLARRALRRLAIVPLHLVNADIRAAALEQVMDEAVVDTAIPGGRLRFFAPSPLLRWRAAGVFTKEPDMTAWLDALPAEAVLWDIGANVGVYSLYAAVRTRCTVLAFEPSAANYHVLAKNVVLNQLTDRVIPYCVALSPTTTLGILNLESTAMGVALSQFGKPGERSRYATGPAHLSHGMLGFTIDDFNERFKPPFPTHLKMDVDGLEWPILQGAVRTLGDPRLRSVMVELNLDDADQREPAIAALAKAGLQFVSRGDAQGKPGEQAANHLFVRA